MTVIRRVMSIFRKPMDDQEYERLHTNEEDGQDYVETPVTKKDDSPFSWLEYVVFMLLGVAMLWAWNMYLAAAPYFAHRFNSDNWILTNFQSSIISVSSVMGLVSMLVLANAQAKASYPKRIGSALVINIVVFALLTLSTKVFRHVSAGVYFGFVLVMVLMTSIATGLCQNGAFALASGFGHPAYTQAIMVGQGIAGVLPPIAQIVSVLFLSPSENGERAFRKSDKTDLSTPTDTSTAALVYFLTATIICVISLLAFIPLVTRHNRLIEERMMESITSVEEAERARRKVVGLGTLYKKLHWLAAAVFMCFAVTMFFPIFTIHIFSVHDPATSSPVFRPLSFIPLAFLFWNIGDLFGRLSTAIPFSLRHRPAFLLIIAIARLGFLPLYLLCNVDNNGAAIPSDTFYLLVVQFGFGLTNGWLGSSCMMGASEWVDEGEREATGGFMGLNLVAGLTAGSFLSFAAAKMF